MFEELALTFIRFLESSHAASFERKKSAMKIEGVSAICEGNKGTSDFLSTCTHSNIIRINRDSLFHYITLNEMFGLIRCPLVKVTDKDRN